MIVMYFTATLTLGCIGLYIIRSYWIWLTSRPLPPGPPRKPIIGNLLDFPKQGCKEWEHWSKHKAQYGPISSLSIMGKTLIILNDAEVAVDMLEKRSAINSSRPSAVFSSDLANGKRLVSINGDADVVRPHRKYITSLIGSNNSMSKLYAQLDLSARHFLSHMLQRPEDLNENIRRYTGASILELVYGYKVEPSGPDPLVDLAALSTSQFSSAVQPGAWMVDIIPVLRYLPAWLPGTGFQRTAQEVGRVLTSLAERPYQFVLRQRKLNQTRSSYVSTHLDAHGDHISTDEEYVIKWTAASMYAAGADVTVSALSTFFLLMARFPDAQRRAQEELDRVVGSRLPTMQDRPNLPYVQALVQEVLRWHPVTPLGVPHMSTEEDEYRGYRIPKGSILIPNVWGFTHDPDTHDEPMTFNPSRFLSRENGAAPECDSSRFGFGFGRRICPGRFLADASLFLTMAKSLAVLNISKRLDDDGEEVELLDEFASGIVSHPCPFQVNVRPRNENCQRLIESIEVEDPWLKGDAKVLDSVKC